MAVLSVSKIVPAGLTATLAAAGALGDSFLNSGNEFLEVLNGDAGSHTVTIAAQRNCDFGVDADGHDIVVAVPAGARKFIGPFPPGKYNDATGKVQIAYDDVTSVTVAARSFAA